MFVGLNNYIFMFLDIFVRDFWNVDVELSCNDLAFVPKPLTYTVRFGWYLSTNPFTAFYLAP